MAATHEDDVGGIHRSKLFWGACASLLPTAFLFAIIGDIIPALKERFILTNFQVGAIGGAALWGMAISQVALGPLADTLGLRNVTRLAFICHALGTTVLLGASFFEGSPDGFWVLLIGAIIAALGNGFIEVACNPLVAGLYPDQKTTKLNHFHAWFPGGIALGGVLCYVLVSAFGANWETRVAMNYVPIVIYGVLLLPERFPPTESARAGISPFQTVAAILFRPLGLLMVFCMIITASLELGPMRWIPSVMQAAGIPGILVLVWISVVMCVLRLFAGPTVERLSPTGILLGAAVVTGAALWLLASAQGATSVFVAATLFAVGVAYFWPTMLGFVNERIPRSGAFGLALMGGIGMLAAGGIANPQMGHIADRYLPEALPQQETLLVLRESVEQFPALAADVEAWRRQDVTKAVELSTAAIVAYETSRTLTPELTANALRAVQAAPVAGSDLPKRAAQLLGPAENYGGRMAFRYLVPLAVLVALIFAGLYLRDRRAGGYRVERIGGDTPAADGSFRSPAHKVDPVR